VSESHGRETAITAVEAWTDGACRGNPGPGGWGVLLRSGTHERELCGGELATTNNRMELTAAIQALSALRRHCRVTLYTDSEYVRRGIDEWLARWKTKGWRTAARKPVKNEDLWRQLDEVARQHDVTWRWVKGHSGHPENERADALANRGLDELLEGQAAQVLAEE
jgi:ribonuclease HI